MASNRQRQKVSRYVWGTLNRLSHSNAHLENDPLGSTYDVNKFGIRVEMTNCTKADELRTCLIDDLRNDGWSVVPMPGNAHVATKWDSDVRIFISFAYLTPHDEGRFCVGVN